MNGKQSGGASIISAWLSSIDSSESDEKLVGPLSQRSKYSSQGELSRATVISWDGSLALPILLAEWKWNSFQDFSTHRIPTTRRNISVGTVTR